MKGVAPVHRIAAAQPDHLALADQRMGEGCVLAAEIEHAEDALAVMLPREGEHGLAGIEECQLAQAQRRARLAAGEEVAGEF